MMEPRQFIRSDIVASLVAHLSVVALLILYSEVYPFGSVSSEPIAIDLVTPAELEKKPEPAPTPDLSMPQSKPAALPPTPQMPEPPPQQRQASRPPPQEPARQSPAQPRAQPPPAASPGYVTPEPDITVKYHVMLGLPAELPAPMSTADKPGDGIDANASTVAKLDSSLIAEFRRHLRTCSRLPAEIAPSDNVMIKLRSVMTLDGTLAVEPVLIEASPSAKGPILMQGAISALRACQPYTMLPRDRYEEWKVIDLVFTPRDFAG